MAQRKEKSKLGGDSASPGSRMLGGSSKATPSKRGAIPVPDPKEERAAHRAKPPADSSTETEELHLVDKTDGSRWTITDKGAIRLLKKYRSASDQKAKDEILKELQSYVSSLGKNSEKSQASKSGSNEASSHQPPTPKTEDLPKMTEMLKNLKLDRNLLLFTSSNNSRHPEKKASRSDKQVQDPKNGGRQGDLDGNRMDVDKNASH